MVKTVLLITRWFAIINEIFKKLGKEEQNGLDKRG
jgi:hypothetical protein